MSIVPYNHQPAGVLKTAHIESLVFKTLTSYRPTLFGVFCRSARSPCAHQDFVPAHAIQSSTRHGAHICHHLNGKKRQEVRRDVAMTGYCQWHSNIKSIYPHVCIYIYSMYIYIHTYKVYVYIYIVIIINLYSQLEIPLLKGIILVWHGH